MWHAYIYSTVILVAVFDNLHYFNFHVVSPGPNKPAVSQKFKAPVIPQIKECPSALLGKYYETM